MLVSLVDAYERNADGSCISAVEPKTQNSMINVCIFTSKSNNVVIADIKEMQLQSGYIISNAITESVPNTLTLTKSIEGGKREIISTRLVGAFFTNLGEDGSSFIDITGTALMEFAASSPSDGALRKLVRVRSMLNNKWKEQNTNGIGTKNNRDLDEDAVESDAGLGVFGMEVGISGSIDGVGATATNDAIGRQVHMPSEMLSISIGTGVALLAVV